METKKLNEANNKLNKHFESKKCFVSIVVPAYNEAEIVENNLTEICDFMKSLEYEYDWELIFVDDGSTDGTGKKADHFAKSRDNVIVLHHFVNFNLGQALKYALNNCRGNYVVTFDLDLSYSTEHIKKLLDAITKTKAKIVIASPYMKGGKVSNVPWLRKILSLWANRFLYLASKGNLKTLTGMVRAYDRQFINSLNLKAMDYEINPEIIYKAQLLRARIIEIPAHLSWRSYKMEGKKRQSSMKMIRSVISSLFSGFIFRPFMFFIIPGLVLMLISLYPLAWAFIHTISQYRNLSFVGLSLDNKFSAAVAGAFKISPHSFIVGGVVLMVSIQLISLGILALQNKRYFEELFHLGTTIYKTDKQI